MEGLHHLVEKCYVTDNMLSLAAQDARSRELRDYLERSALLFKDLGDHLFLAVVAGGGKPYFDHDDRDTEERPWVDKTSFGSAREHFDYFRIAVNAQNRAVSELRGTLDGRRGKDDLHLLLSKGIAELARNIQRGLGT